MDAYSTIINGYLAQYACQATVCGFTAFLLFRLSTWRPQPLMRWWAMAWAGLAGYIACAGAGLKMVVDGAPVDGLARTSVASLSIFCASIHLVCFMAGWRAEKTGADFVSASRLKVGAAVLLVASFLAGVLLHSLAPGDVRFFCKVTLRGLLVFAAYSWVGVSLLRYSALMPLIRYWLGGALLAFALKHLHYAWLSHFGPDSRFQLEYYLQFIELGLHTVIVAPLLLWFCLGFVQQRELQADELGRMDKLIKRKDQLLEQRQRLASIGRMASGIAHDFNNILSVIMGWTDMMRHGAQLDELASEGVDAIEAAASQAGDISKKLLLFGGNRHLSPTRHSPAEVAREAMSMVHGLRERGTSVNIGEGLPHVCVDRSLLLVSIQNLLINSVEATEVGDAIDVTLSDAMPGEEFCKLHGLKQGQYVLVQVTDTGSGIPEEVLEQVYEPFFTTKEHGTGLGLASVHGFLKQSGGGIDITSRPGEGTTIAMWIPIAEEPLEDFVLKPKPAGRSSSASIVIVDDEEAIGRYVAGVLKRAGYSVYRTASPVEALEECRRLGPRLSLLLSDVRMPEMSGVELALKVLKKCPATSVLFVTGFADEVDISSFEGLCQPSFLQKPVMSLELLNAVESLVHGSVVS